MKGDFTRNTFNADKQFTRVLMQQGRVQLDADWNEQTAIFWDYIRTLATDLIGPYGGPIGNAGFEINSLGNNNFEIGDGNYYVNGILCRNPKRFDADVNGILCRNPERFDADVNTIPLMYKDQPFFPVPDEDELPDNYLVYLDVWERHITHVEDPSIREVALRGPDTATRAQGIWQVKWQKLTNATDCNEFEPSWDDLIDQWQPKNRGCLVAKAKEEEDLDNPCNLPPESRYRGKENQLYRVEIHEGCEASGKEATFNEKQEGGQAGGTGATFKWSRDNGSHIFSIRKTSGNIVTVDQLGRDEKCSLEEGDWVEIMDDDRVLRNELPSEGLLKVAAVDQDTMKVTLDVPVGKTIPFYDETSTKHPLLRRWDQKATSKVNLTDEGVITITEDVSLDLEDGIQICFENSNATYRRGDYWLIPARTATGDVEWPKDKNLKPLLVPPHGVNHYYAPLAVVTSASTKPFDCRYKFGPISIPIP